MSVDMYVSSPTNQATSVSTMCKSQIEGYNELQKAIAGNRVIAIHNKLCKLLEKWKTSQTDLLIKYIEKRSILEVRIFEETPYRIIDADTLRKKYDSILSRDPGLKRIRIHDFRHSM